MNTQAKVVKKFENVLEERDDREKSFKKDEKILPSTQESNEVKQENLKQKTT